MLVSAYAKHLATLLRHGAGRADRGRRARQRQRAGELRRAHAAVDLADPAQAAPDRLEDQPAVRSCARCATRRSTSSTRWPRPTGNNVQRQFLDAMALSQHAGARAGRRAGDDAERDHRRRRQGAGAGGGGADRGQRHAGGDRCTSRSAATTTPTPISQAEAAQTRERRAGDPAVDGRARRARAHRQGDVRDHERLRPQPERYRQDRRAHRARSLRQPRGDGDDRQEHRARR